MATPTEAEVQTQLGLCIKFLDEIYQFGGTATDNVIGMYDAIVAALEGDYVQESLLGAREIRARIDSAFDLGRRMLDPLWLMYGKVKDYPETDPIAIIRRLRDAFTSGSDNVQERNFTFGSPSAGGSNVGDGTVNRLTTDENGDDIEGTWAEAMSGTCIADEHSGAEEHEEVFLLRGGNRAADRLLLEGSGLTQEIKGLSARDSEQFLTNPSFTQNTGGVGALTAVTGWTANSAIGNFDLNTNTYRSYTGEGDTPYSLRIDAADTLYQNFNERKARFNPDIPYYIQCAVNPTVGSASGGTFRLTLGAVSATLTVAGMSSGWNIVRILGQSNWFSQWNQEDPCVKVGWESASSGYLLVDDVVLAPMVNFAVHPQNPLAGTWYAVVGGATPFLVDDVFTWTDSEVGAIIQFWIWFLYGEYLPGAASTPTWAEPT